MVKTARKKREKLSSEELKTRNQLLQKLEASGDLARLKASIYAQLILQESWRDEMKEGTRQAVKQSGGISEITLDELIEQLLPVAKASIPQSIEAEMRRKIREALLSEMSKIP